MNTIKVTQYPLKLLALRSMLGAVGTTCALLIGAPTQVTAQTMFEDEDTILVEKQASQKIPYSKIVRKIGQRLFQVDTYKVLSFGQGKRGSVVRSFKDIAEHSKYRFNVRRDELELKYTLYF